MNYEDIVKTCTCCLRTYWMCGCLGGGYYWCGHIGRGYVGCSHIERDELASASEHRNMISLRTRFSGTRARIQWPRRPLPKSGAKDQLTITTMSKRWLVAQRQQILREKPGSYKERNKPERNCYCPSIYCNMYLYERYWYIWSPFESVNNVKTCVFL